MLRFIKLETVSIEFRLISHILILAVIFEFILYMRYSGISHIFLVSLLLPFDMVVGFMETSVELSTHLELKSWKIKIESLQHIISYFDRKVSFYQVVPHDSIHWDLLKKKKLPQHSLDVQKNTVKIGHYFSFDYTFIVIFFFIECQFVIYIYMS